VSETSSAGSHRSDERQLKVFLGLPAETRRLLLRDTVRCTFPPHQEISHDDADVPVVGVILAGLTRAYLRGPDGREQTVRYLRSGDLIGAPVLFGGPASICVECLSAVAVARLTPVAVQQLMRHDPLLATTLARELLREHLATVEQLHMATFFPVRQRVARHLIMRAQAEGSVLDLTQKDLARTVGSVREVVGRTMQDLERTGAVSRRADGRLEIDLAALEVAAAGRRQ